MSTQRIWQPTPLEDIVADWRSPYDVESFGGHADEHLSAVVESIFEAMLAPCGLYMTLARDEQGAVVGADVQVPLRMAAAGPDEPDTWIQVGMYISRQNFTVDRQAIGIEGLRAIHDALLAYANDTLGAAATIVASGCARYAIEK